MKWVFVDSSFLAHRTRFAMRALLSDDNNAIIFGFLEQLRTICEDPRIRSNAVHLFFDSKKSYRKRFFPAYKEKRNTQKHTGAELLELKSMKSQLNRLRIEVLPQIGFPCFKQSGLESDDLIASAAKAVTGTDTAVIITSDSDLYQCITPRVDWFDPVRNLYYDVPTFTRDKGVQPSDWLTVKCLAGCETDEVPGVPGVGEKTALDYIWKDLPKHYKAYAAITSKNGQKVRERNRELVQLPHRKTREVELMNVKLSGSAFIRWAGKLGFKSWIGDREAHHWAKFFGGFFGPQPRERGKKRRK